MSSQFQPSGSRADPVLVREEEMDYDSDTTLDDIDSSEKQEQTILLPGYGNLPPPEVPWVNEDACRIPCRNIRLRVLDAVELMGNNTNIEDYWSKRNGDFFLVRQILRNAETDQIKLVGHRLRRNCYLSELLSAHDDVNEVCLLASSSHGPATMLLPHGLHEISLSQVFKVRTLVITNLPFPKLKSREWNEHGQPIQGSGMPERYLRDSGVLLCRWTYSMPSLKLDTAQTKLDSGVLRRFSEAECRALVMINGPYTVSDDQLLNESHGHLPTQRSPGVRRSFFDVFCGLGGTSEGAERAGFFPTNAVDIDSNACATYSLNHPETNLYHASVDQSLIVAFADRNTDNTEVVHVSSVCKTFSPAHTIPGRDDETNQATLFCVNQVLKACRPRVLTLEQTSGIVTHHPNFFKALINMITSASYSVRWKILHLNEYGGAQCRKRLIIFASCPGGTLPAFPRPSRGPRSEFQIPFATVRDALEPSRLAGSVTHNDTQEAGRRYRNSRNPGPPARLDAPLRHCITTHGPTETHPTERRNFTVRETASLQGFPVSYRFVRGQTHTSIMTQIGNAVPPVAAEELFREIMTALDIEDRLRARRLGRL